MKDKLITQADFASRLRAAASPDMRRLMAKVATQLNADMRSQEARFESYRPQRPADEPHDKGCQITRWGDGLGHSCTCESNTTRRRQQIINAGKAKDYAFRETLGSMERHTFDGAAKGEYR